MADLPEVVSFTPLPAGWVNLYVISDQKFIDHCPGVLVIQNHDDGDSWVTVHYAASGDGDDLICASEVAQGYLCSKYVGESRALQLVKHYKWGDTHAL